MKTLIIIRHAKSSWSFPVIDKKRPLIKLGEEAIKKVAEFSKSFLTEEFTIWSSPATRAFETAKIFCKTLLIDEKNILIQPKLYTFGLIDFENEIKSCDDTINNLIVFGHNESINDFVNKYGNKLILNVPTSGLVFIKFEQNSWSSIEKGTTIKTIFPKEIE